MQKDCSFCCLLPLCYAFDDCKESVLTMSYMFFSMECFVSETYTQHDFVRILVRKLQKKLQFPLLLLLPLLCRAELGIVRKLLYLLGYNPFS